MCLGTPFIWHMMLWHWPFGSTVLTLLNKHGMCGKSDIFRTVQLNLIAAKALSCAELMFKQVVRNGVTVSTF
jgi:hypothetical protein